MDQPPTGPAPPQLSPDGRWWWNGQAWVSVATGAQPTTPARPLDSGTGIRTGPAAVPASPYGLPGTLMRKRGALFWVAVGLAGLTVLGGLLGYVTTRLLAPSHLAPNVEVARVAYEWSFADAAHGPDVEDNSLDRVFYPPGGGLEVDLKQPTNYRFYAPMDLVRDMRVEVDLQFLSPLRQGETVPSAGVICRGFPTQWFFFRIWTNGDAAIFRIRGQNADDWLRVPVDGPKVSMTDTLHLRADCVGGQGSPITLTLDVNGKRILTGFDDVPGPLAKPGQAGIMMDTGNNAPLAVVYRTLVVSELRVVGQ